MRTALLLVALLAYRPVLAEEPLQITNAYVQYRSSDGSEFRPTNLIPYIVAESCYYWVIEFEPGYGAVAISEELTLPSAGNWGRFPGDGVQVASDKESAITPRTIDLATGMASHGWCVRKGDPKGHYQYTLRAGSTVLATLPFELVPPTQQAWIK